MSPQHAGHPLRVAVVGHTNAGKTSLLRTLMRDARFGEVSDRPGTTRDVEGALLMVAGRPSLELYDTPGLEDSIALLEHLDSIGEGRRLQGIDRIEQFLQGPESHARFTQEAKALRQTLSCDVVLYVIDARDMVLAKYRDELQTLSYCARPVVPVLNFLAFPDVRVNEWREALARLNLHAIAEFDTVVFDAEGEVRLFEKMRTLMDAHRATFDRLIEDRRRQRAELIDASLGLIADMLVDVAAHSVPVDVEEISRSEQPLNDLRDRVRRREERCVRSLMELHRFRAEDCVSGAVPVEGGAWGTDLFSPQALQEYGVGGTGGAAAGAMVGLTLDILFHGISLGAATAIGAAIGAALGAGRLPGKRLLERATGRTNLRVDDATLQVLAAREIHLLDALLQRGHARTDRLEVDNVAPAPLDAAALRPVVKSLRRARGRPRYSRITQTGGRPAGPRWAPIQGGTRDAPPATPIFDSGRDALVQEVAAALAVLRQTR